MKSMISSVSKRGSLFIKPNWRWELLHNPAKYKMQDFVCYPANNAGCLKRFVTTGLICHVNLLPDYLREYTGSLDDDQYKLLNTMWRRYLKRTNQKMLNIDTNVPLFRKNPSWNIQMVNELQDEWLKKLILHHAGYKWDQDVHDAVQWFNSPEHQEIFHFIGYGIYAKIEDTKLAKRWGMTLGQIKAIRHLFYDFSRFPQDKVASFAYLRQLANIGVFSDVDFAFFKRVLEMGELGIKAQVDFTGLDHDEKKQVQQFLSGSIVSNVLNVNFAIRNQKDAIQYGTLVQGLSNYYIQEKEAAYFDSKIKNLDATTRRIEGSMVDENAGISDNDVKMLDLLREHSLQEADRPQYKTLDMLN